ncbi:EAL domain-containing protein [Hydrogenimonas sp.]
MTYEEHGKNAGTRRSNRFTVLFTVIVLLAVLYNLYFAYDQLRRVEKFQTFVAHRQAQTLDAFLVAFRNTYQKRFIENHIPLDEKSIRLLPVAVTPEITGVFSRINHDKAIIRVVSDNPRNPANMANETEMRAIEFFKKHPSVKEMYETLKKDGEEQFFYATPLYIEKRCLKCHGRRRDAPEYIRTHYDRAYDYRLGDLRGIIGIYLSQNALKESIESIVYRNIFKMVAITLAFLAVFYFLLKKIFAKEEEYTRKLERDVRQKTEEIRKKSDELEHRFYHDPLTGLPNRNALIRDLERRNGGTLILLNIDGFNEINDFYGHDTGDALIAQLAKLLRELCHKEGKRLYRMPSDEFAVSIPQKLSPETLKKQLEKLTSAIKSQDFSIEEGTTIHLRVAVGASTSGPDLLITADMALKRAKAEHKESLVYNDTIDLSAHYKKNLEWAERLKAALEEDRVVPYFQPIVDPGKGTTFIYEALIRIVGRDGTVHTPYEFLDIAKRTRYYPELTRRMTDKVVEAAARLPHHFSLNISYLDIVNKETMAYIIRRIGEAGIEERMHFEILESEGIERYDDVFGCLRRLKELGCRISLDDFGSGYSNFEHILKLDVDTLKIDGSLIRNIHNDIGSQIIVETIVDFADKLGIGTCAEFVASEEVFETVKDLGVNYVQGYYLGEPKPLDDLV